MQVHNEKDGNPKSTKHMCEEMKINMFKTIKY